MIINQEFIRCEITNNVEFDEVGDEKLVSVPYRWSHGATDEHLGDGLIIYSLIQFMRAKICVCLGSGGGFIPRIMTQARLDLHSQKIEKRVGLWKKGINVPKLIKIIKKHKLSPEIKNVVVCIGTNDLYVDLGIEKLINTICRTFPNSKIYVVQGSWGWGGLKNTTEQKVRKYYQKFKDLGVTVIEPPIGNIEPHGNKPVYKKIGASLDGKV